MKDPNKACSEQVTEVVFDTELVGIKTALCVGSMKGLGGIEWDGGKLLTLYCYK